MSFFNFLTLKFRKKKLGKLLTNYTLNNTRNWVKQINILNNEKNVNRMDRDKLIDFLNDDNKMIGIDINDCYISDIDGPPLSLAILTDDYELFSLILSKGADSTVRWGEWTIPDLMYHCAFDLRFYKWFKKSGYDFNKELIIGAMPLNLYTSHLHQEKIKNEKGEASKLPEVKAIIDFLFEQNIDVNKASKLPPPLTEAIFLGEFEFAKRLIKAGANIKKKYYSEEFKKELDAKEFIEHSKDKLNKNVYKKTLEFIKKHL